MSMIRYTHPMLGLQQQINRMFDQFDSDLFGHMEELGEGMFAPPVDVREDADAYTVHLEVPGVPQEQLNLTLQDNVLTIQGVKEQQREAGEGRYRRIERSYGSFSRSLSLPRNVDAAAVTANLEDGVLEVRLPKHEAARPRQIAVTTTHNGHPNGATYAMANGGNNDHALQEEQPSPQRVAIEAPAQDDAKSAEQSTPDVPKDVENEPEGHPT